jgi:hypothetical protein
MSYVTEEVIEVLNRDTGQACYAALPVDVIRNE